jgi:SAM-dependent methyltransferase
MDTGGGERLAAIVGPHGVRGVATEEWAPNVPVARARLAPLGIDIVRGASSALPFSDACFDLVLNRHGALNAVEVDRVLRPGGWFVTQQVRDGRGWNWRELDVHFPRRPLGANHFEEWVETLRSAGYELEARRAERGVAYP